MVYLVNMSVDMFMDVVAALVDIGIAGNIVIIYTQVFVVPS